jgi:peptidoglycan/xylan/chitin deacetylase (PgdA/CDA1 family)
VREVARTLLLVAILCAAPSVAIGVLLRSLGLKPAGSAWIAASAGAAAFALLAWGTVSLDAPLFGRVANRGPSRCDTGALTFDDGPSPSATPAVLDLLRRTETPATFFLVGRRAIEFPEIVRRIRAEGHGLGNHSFSHRALVFMTPGMIRRELERTDDAIRRAAGVSPAFARPPYGLRGPFTVRAIRARGEMPVGWSLYPGDASRPPAEKIVVRVLARAHAGDILLLHDGGGDRSATVAALPRILDGLRAKGLAVVPLQDLLAGRCDGGGPPARR